MKFTNTERLPAITLTERGKRVLGLRSSYSVFFIEVFSQHARKIADSVALYTSIGAGKSRSWCSKRSLPHIKLKHYNMPESTKYILPNVGLSFFSVCNNGYVVTVSKG